MLRATFKVEAAEHLQAIAAGLLALEKSPGSDEERRLIETVFRAAHSLKGAARAVNLSEVETICQALEDRFSGWKRGRVAVSPPELDAAHRSLDALSSAIAGPGEATVAPPPPKTASTLQHPAARIVQQPQAATTPATKSTEKTASGDTVRIAISKLDARLLEAEEMLAAKLATEQRALELTALAGQFESWRKEWAKAQPQARALRHSGTGAALTEFFEWNHDYLRSLEGRIAALRQAAERDRSTVGKLVDDLLADSKKLLMLPLATLGGLLPKLVRDLSRDQGKEAELTIQGEDVELDKRILEEIKDPLVHLLRNSVDHGIEMPEQRRALGKPPRATITLSVSAINGDRVEITVSDDGAGIDVAALKADAIKRGLLTTQAAQSADEAQILALIFEPDVSTSPIVTQLSGRGLGLAIVREKAEKLGGRVAVESRRGAGVTIRVSLPVTLATFRGIQIAVADRLFVLPTVEVERVTRFKPRDVQTVEGRETLVLNGRTVALVRLADVLELPVTAPADPNAAKPAVILGVGEQRMAFAIDTLLDEQEVLVKQFTKPLVRVRHIAGATILGSGKVAPILRISDLLKSARQAGAPARASTQAKPVTALSKSILVVEDSITSRLLLKGILESAGYRVRTAVDGLEAFTTLRTETFDLVVSDVEMPRLNGFDLTANIRADRKLAALPVILVTALATREDRERGIEVGANAYLVKSNFDQSNLLDAVRRLV